MGTENVITKDKDGRKLYNMHIYSRFNFLFHIFYLWGLMMRLIPRKIGDRLFVKFKLFGLDWSKAMMAGMPIQDFKENASFVIVPDSKFNEIKTSDGKMIFPHLLVIEMLKRVCAYDPEHSIARGYFCICRETRNCKNHPHNIGCMIVGPGAMDVVERGLGKFISLENAIELIENEIMPRNLSALVSVFPSDLKYFWGVKSHHSKYSFEICSCCNCCCLVKKPHFFIPNDPSENKNFIDIRGFRAKVNYNKCTGCGKCIDQCSVNSISYLDVLTKNGNIRKKVKIERCLGCGHCIPSCPHNAIEIVATESFDHLEDLLGIFEYYKLEKEEFLVKLNKKYHEINKKLI